MYTEILRMAYLGDGISSDDDSPEEEKGHEEVEGVDVPPIPREDLLNDDEPGENE
ncbi:MAG: hypothetical protein V1656_02845 [Candidatus Jorgensenbacteria bacterium]